MKKFYRFISFLAIGVFCLISGNALAKFSSVSQDATSDSEISALADDELVDLTQEMYHRWTAADETAQVTNGTFSCDYVLNSSTGMPYGNGNVEKLEYADLSEYSQLIITASAGAPRPLFNRDIDNGQAPDHLIDIPHNANHKASYQTEKVNGDGTTSYIIDLAKILKDKGYVHLHSIKGANYANVTVTSMKLKKATNDEEEESSQYVSLSLSDFNPNIHETGKYELSNGVGTFYAGQYGFGGWKFDSGYDVSNYETAIVEFAEPAESSAIFRLFKVNNYWAGESGYVQAECGGKTSASVDISNIDKLYIIGFWSYGKTGAEYTRYIKIKSVKFIPKEGSEITEPETPSTPAVIPDGAIELTAADLKTWSAADNTGVVTGNASGAYNLNTTTDLVYGTSTVHYLNYADLSKADKLYVVVNEGTPRFLFNRITDGGTVGVAIPDNGGTYQTIINNADGTKTYVIDIAGIVNVEDFAHLHAIKSNWNTTVNVKTMYYTLASDTPSSGNDDRTVFDGIYGDVNADGEITVADQKMLIDMLNGKIEDNGRCDVNEDTEVDVDDAKALEEMLLGTYEPNYNWVGTWTSAQYERDADKPQNLQLANNSLREIVEVSVGGSKLRFKFSNVVGKENVEIKSVDIAIAKTQGASPKIYEETTKTLLFGGKKNTVIPVGGEIVSDPILFKINPRDNVAITIHYGACGNTSITTHPGSRTTSYLATGNTNDFSSPAMSFNLWYHISGIDVVGNKRTRAVAVLGNSITDGRGSTTNKQDRWTDFLSRSLLKNEATKDVAVLNLGIGGNLVLGGGLGPRALDRYEHDIFQQAGVKYFIIFIGTNDLGYSGNPSQTASGLIEAFTKMAQEAHALGIKVFGATITPVKNSGHYSVDKEKARQTVNNWIRTNTIYDGFIDFDKMVSNPNDPEAILPLYNDDNLHLNANGYKAMGEGVDVSLFEEDK